MSNIDYKKAIAEKLEARLKNRSVLASKSILIGSAALSILAYSLFSFNKLRKKKKHPFS